MRLAGKVALVTGGASGIGEASAVLFAREGAAVAVCDISTEGASRVASRIEADGGRALAVTGDVSARADVERMVAETVTHFGNLDILVNSAGVTVRTSPPGLDWEGMWDRVMAVNLKGTYMMCKVAGEEMRTSGGGSIINLSSIYGLVGRPAFLGDGLDPYTHSKGAVVQLTREFGVSLAKEGVRVNCLCPGFANTALTAALRENPDLLSRLESLHPMGRLAEPEEIASAALFLASDEASFVTGAALAVDGGYTAQ